MRRQAMYCYNTCKLPNGGQITNLHVSIIKQKQAKRKMREVLSESIRTGSFKIHRLFCRDISSDIEKDIDKELRTGHFKYDINANFTYDLVKKDNSYLVDLEKIVVLGEEDE